LPRVVLYVWSLTGAPGRPVVLGPRRGRQRRGRLGAFGGLRAGRAVACWRCRRGGSVLGLARGSEPPIPIKARVGVWITCRAVPSHICLTDCADGGGLGGPAWDYYRGQRGSRDLLDASSAAGGQGVAGSNPVVPTARARPGELVLVQLTGPLSCPDLILSMIYTASRLGPIWDPRRCSDKRAAASVTDCRSGCRYRCVVVSDPCPSILPRTCTGPPALAIKVRSECRRSRRRRCS
jgi:hypothetical protein